jgi:hypothetical protein
MCTVFIECSCFVNGREQINNRIDLFCRSIVVSRSFVRCVSLIGAWIRILFSSLFHTLTMGARDKHVEPIIIMFASVRHTVVRQCSNLGLLIIDEHMRSSVDLFIVETAHTHTHTYPYRTYSS